MVITESLAIVASVIVFGLVLYARIRQASRQQEKHTKIRRKKALSLPDESALDQEIDFDELRRSSAALEALGPRVSAVHVMRTMTREGDDLFEAYVIDVNGLPASFALEEDRPVVLQRATWLAGQLDVPFSDDT